MAHTKDFHTLIRGGGDDAIAALEECLNTRDSVLRVITDTFAWPRWIPVSERLPDSRATCLVACERGFVTAMEYTSNEHAKTEKGRRWRWEWNGRISPWTVTHWMPLPAPPEA